MLESKGVQGPRLNLPCEPKAEVMCIWTPLKKTGDLSGDTTIPPEVGLGKHT